MSDGSRPQPTQARLTATGKGAPPSSSAGGTPRSTAGWAAATLAAGWAAAALAASLSSAFSAISASRTSLVTAPRSGCCSRSLASNGLTPSSGSASHSPRTASTRASVMPAAVRSSVAGKDKFGGGGKHGTNMSPAISSLIFFRSRNALTGPLSLSPIPPT
eukprot:scaffold52464_cov63-Phaeocystis_antarctica.AAC.4